MKIGIDGRLWNQTGVGRYTRNLVINLLMLGKKNQYILFALSRDEKDIRDQISKLKTKNLKFKIVSVDIKWHSLREQLLFVKQIEKEKVDLMHFPYFSIPILYRGQFVVTIHDLILHHFVSGESSTLPVWLYGFKMIMYRFIIRSASKRAIKIIAVSENTKKEIEDHLNTDAKKIEVIYEAADDFKVSEGNLKLKDFFLYVGNVYPHKNVATLVRAFKKVAEKGKIKLVFVGAEDHSYKKLKVKVKDLEGYVVFDHQVNDSKLGAYYKNALCLVRPSYMEGFSLPPLEAMANGCIVLSSDIPVHREILGDASLYFDSQSDTDLAQKMLMILNMNEDNKKDIRKKGLAKSEEFSWRETARQTLKVYESSASANSA